MIVPRGREESRPLEPAAGEPDGAIRRGARRLGETQGRVFVPGAELGVGPFLQVRRLVERGAGSIVIVIRDDFTSAIQNLIGSMQRSIGIRLEILVDVAN